VVAVAGSAPRRSVTDRVPAWSLAVVSICSVQVGAALSTGLFPVVGTAGAAWLRLTAGALIFLAIGRPRPADVPRSAIPAVLALGLVTATMTVAFLAAIDRLALGTAVAIEFLGPLSVAAARAHRRRMLAWPALALVGVVLLTRPWQGEVDVVGVLYALAAAVGWGAYILLTQHVGDRVAGLKGLSLTIPVAALAAAVVGVPQAIGGITWQVAAASVGLALLLPVLPFSLELLALRRLTAHAFGTLMALEPAIAMLVGAVVLLQTPAPLQLLGIVLVVAAGVGAERGGRRDDGPEALGIPVPEA
jgi:inner membrane transporter RhtA